MNRLDREFKKCPQKGHFFIVLFACFFLLLIIIPGYLGSYKIELSSTEEGNSGILLSNDQLLSWNINQQKATYFGKSGEEIQFDLEGYPIDGALLNGKNQGLVFQYLSPCTGLIEGNNKRMAKRCLDPKEWIPAALCECNGKNFLATFRSLPTDGVKKKFPYYLPVVNRFEYGVFPADRFLNGTLSIRSGGKGVFVDYWHEESAGSWKISCLSETSTLLLNPMAEKLVKITLPAMKIEWTADTGQKPNDMAIDAGSQKVYIASAQQNEIGVFDLLIGKKLDSIKTEKGIRSLVLMEKRIIAVNPYRRTWSIIDPDSKKIRTKVVKDHIPTAVAVSEGRILIAYYDTKNLLNITPEEINGENEK